MKKTFHTNSAKSGEKVPLCFNQKAKGSFMFLGILVALGLSAPNLRASEYSDKTPSDQKDSVVKGDDGAAKPYSADNSGINKRDTRSGLPTAENQLENKTDLELTQKIRQSVVADDSLSTNAKNVKIVTMNNVVTLRGPVKTQTEADIIAEKAKNTAGVTKVNNNLEVAE